MDVKISDGDTVLLPSGEPMYIDGAEEKLQQVLFCITTRKGEFIYDKKFGIDLAKGEVYDEKELEADIRNAAAIENGTEINLKKVRSLQNGKKEVEIEIEYEGEVLSEKAVI